MQTIPHTSVFEIPVPARHRALRPPPCPLLTHWQEAERTISQRRVATPADATPAAAPARAERVMFAFD